MTSRQLPTRSRRQRWFLAAAIGVTTTSALSGCATGESSTHMARPHTTISAAPKGTVTVEEADRLLDHYEAVNNKANKAQDARLLGTVEGGQVYEQSKADFRQWDTKSAKEQRQYEKSWFYVDRTYLIPPQGTNWFAVSARFSDSKTRALVVMAKTDGTWKVVASLDLDDSATLPKIDTSNHGLITPVKPSVRSGTLAASGLSDAYEDLFETGGSKAGKAIDQKGALAKDALDIYRNRNKGKDARMATTEYTRTEPRHDEVFALKLADGGVLALAPTAHKSTFALKPAYYFNYQITPSKEASVYNSAERPVVVTEYQGMVMAELPKRGKAELVAREYRLVDAQ
uniref:Lipoprotein n=1 Tax=Streptomyces sp. F12 TaxID=1436084 RepID=V9Z7D9_9ACTN|nr:hypothetical protein [Streptomyces sp. F12]AHE40457.1 Lipoprotein [Streptomyces sp. F12]